MGTAVSPYQATASSTYDSCDGSTFIRVNRSPRPPGGFADAGGDHVLAVHERTLRLPKRFEPHSTRLRGGEQRRPQVAGLALHIRAALARYVIDRVAQPEWIPGYPAHLDVQHMRSPRSLLSACPGRIARLEAREWQVVRGVLGVDRYVRRCLLPDLAHELLRFVLVISTNHQELPAPDDHPSFAAKPGRQRHRLLMGGNSNST